MAELNLLGLGSNNQLNANMIKTLKEVDEAAQLSPLRRMTEETEVKIDKLGLIRTAFSTFSDSIKLLSNPINYGFLNISGNSTVDIKTKDGAQANNISMNVTQLARGDVYQSNKFATESQLTTTDQNLVIKAGFLPNVNVFIPAGSTYAEARDLLSSIPGVEAKIVKVSDLEFRMTLFSETTGSESAISIVSEDPELQSIFGFSNPLNHSQVAQNAEFTYNGVVMSRSTNTFSDLDPNVTFTLKTIGQNEIVMETDHSALTASIQDFVSEYNLLLKTIAEESKGTTTDSNLFRTNREVREIFQNINSQLFERNFNMQQQKEPLDSVSALGIQKNRDGTLSINLVNGKSLPEISEAQFAKIKELFTNKVDGSPSLDGVFVQIQTAVEKMINKSNTGTIDSLYTSYTNSKAQTTLQIEKVQAKIDLQYQTMTKKFAAFDALISKMNAGFSALKLEMEQSVAKPQ